ncbi:MAG TPA: hypothetical protein VFC67_19105 [Prolixibacteraceae bacterium]|nr:hypothetical protein [Prolixibacteraceae bacterium]
MKANILIALFLMTGFSLCGQNSSTLTKNLTFEEALSLSLRNQSFD